VAQIHIAAHSKFQKYLYDPRKDHSGDRTPFEAVWDRAIHLSEPGNTRDTSRMGRLASLPFRGKFHRERAEGQSFPSRGQNHWRFGVMELQALPAGRWARRPVMQPLTRSERHDNARALAPGGTHERLTRGLFHQAE